MDIVEKRKTKNLKIKMIHLIKNIKIILLLVLPLLAGACGPSIDKEVVEGKIMIGEKEIFVEIADTPQKRETGLMNRESLPKDQGMLFLFDGYGEYSFWMKDTLIPLDIIWISDDRIVHIEKEIQPSNELIPPRYNPKKLANMVLEVNAGAVDKNNWKTGDTIEISWSLDE